MPDGLGSYPDLLASWDPELNEGFDPTALEDDSPHKAWWVCPDGHQWRASVANRALRRTNCPVCVDSAYQSTLSFETARRIVADSGPKHRWKVRVNERNWMEAFCRDPSDARKKEIPGYWWHKLIKQTGGDLAPIIGAEDIHALFRSEPRGLEIAAAACRALGVPSEHFFSALADVPSKDGDAPSVASSSAPSGPHRSRRPVKNRKARKEYSGPSAKPFPNLAASATVTFSDGVCVFRYDALGVRATVAPRGSSGVLEAPGSDLSGVYVLLGQPAPDRKTWAYAGKTATGFSQRMASHDSQKAEWNRAIMFTAARFDTPLLETELSWLEPRLIELLRKGKAVDCANRSRPKALLDDAQAAHLLPYLPVARAVIALCGVPL